MGNGKTPMTEINRRVEGEPITVGDRTIQPVSRLLGRQINADGEHGGFAGVMAQLQPLEIVVRQGDEEHTVPVVDPQQEPLRGIFMAGVAVCVGCVVIMLLARLLAKRMTRS